MVDALCQMAAKIVDIVHCAGMMMLATGIDAEMEGVYFIARNSFVYIMPVTATSIAAVVIYIHASAYTNHVDGQGYRHYSM